MKKVINTKLHRCRFNDGECNCQCYIDGIKAVKRALKIWFKKGTEPIEEFIERL